MPQKLPFASREGWIGIRGFICGFATAVIVWGVTVGSTLGSAMSGAAFLVITAVVFSAAFRHPK